MQWLNQLCQRGAAQGYHVVSAHKPREPALPSSSPEPRAACDDLSTSAPHRLASPSGRASVTPPSVYPTLPTAPIFAAAPGRLAPPVAALPRPLVVHDAGQEPRVLGIPVQRAVTTDQDAASVPRATQAELVLVPSTQVLLRNLAVAWRRRRMVLIEGPTSAGKTAAVRYMAYKTESSYRRVNLSDATDVGDLLGRYVAGELRYNDRVLDTMSNAELEALCAQYGVEATDRGQRVADLLRAQLEPHWVDGPVVTAIKRGEVLLLDEINLAPPAVVERLNSLLDDDGNVVLTEHKGEVIKPHPGFRPFATCNPAQYVGRKSLSEAFRSRCMIVRAPALSPQDLVQIVTARFGTAIPRDDLGRLVQVHQHLSDLAERRLMGRCNDGIVYTLRDLMKVCARFVHFRRGGLNDAALMRRETEEVYGGGLVDAEDRLTVNDLLKTSMPYDGPGFYVGLQLSEDATSFTIGDVRVRKLNLQGSRVPDASARLVLTERTMQVFYRLCKALEMGENVALIGERATGKTAIARMYAHLRGQDCYRQQFSADTDAAQIMGGWDLQGWNDGCILQAGRCSGRPGVYVADELNLASPALLERLNPVLDDERRLVLAERDGESICLDPDFRFIAAMNPVGRNNTGRVRLSSAMHNRFTEIFVPDVDSLQEQRDIVQARARGRVSEACAERLVNAHGRIVVAYQMGEFGAKQPPQQRPVMTLRQLLEALEVVADLQDLVGEADAFALAVESQYAAQADPADRAALLRLAGA